MASSRSLGTLTLDLIARIGGFKEGLDQASRITDTRVRTMEASFARLGGAIKGIAAIFGVGFGLHKFVEETAKAQKELAQLNAAIKATGNSAGLTVPEFIKLSKEIQDTTTFSDEAALAASRVLLQFGKLQGAQFERALKLSADFAKATGSSLEEAATTIGRATAGAARGLLRLSVAGATFSKGQQKLIADLRAAGKAAEANEVIFKELERAVGGQATSDINTLGGSLERLKNKFNDLFELEGGDTEGIVKTINLIADNLGNIARAATIAATSYAAFKAVVIAGDIVNAINATVVAQKAARVEAIGAAAASRAKAVAELREATAAEAVTKAELDRTFAMVQGTRATYARVVADTESTATAATRATVMRNAAKAEEAFFGAAAAQAAAGQRAGAAAIAASAATTKLGEATAKTAGKMSLLLAPFRAIGAFAVANPFTAIALAVGAVGGVLFSFRKEIKLSEDGVVDLGNATQATFEIIGEALADIGHFFADIGSKIAAAFDVIIPDTIEWGKALKNILSLIPGMNIMVALLDKLGGKIAERAREIAAEKAAAEKALESVGTGVDSGGTTTAADAEAVKKIQALIDDIKKSNIVLGEGEVAAIKYRIAQGDLKDEFAKLGPEAEKYKAILIQVTAEHERFEKAKKAAEESKTATKQIKDLTIELQQQIATYGKGEGAVFEYNLAHGDLAETFKKVQGEVDPLKEKLLQLNRELENKRIAEQIRDINIQILELRGNTSEAVALRFDIQNQGLNEALSRTGNTAGQEAVAKLRELTIAQAQFNEQRKKADEITAALQRTEERFHIAAEAGAYTDLEALARIGDARKASVADLRKIYDEMKRIADLSGNKELIAQAEDFGVQLEQLASQTELVADQIETTLKDAFSSSFADFVKGTKSAEDAFRSFVDAIYTQMLNLIAQNFAQQLFGGFSGSSWGSAIAGLFTADYPSRGYAGVPRIIGAGAQPEVFVPDSAGTFMPNADQMGWGGNKVEMNFMISAPEGGRVSKSTQQQLASAAMRGLAEANRRNN